MQKNLSCRGFSRLLVRPPPQKKKKRTYVFRPWPITNCTVYIQRWFLKSSKKPGGGAGVRFMFFSSPTQGTNPKIAIGSQNRRFSPKAHHKMILFYFSSSHVFYKTSGLYWDVENSTTTNRTSPLTRKDLNRQVQIVQTI